MKLFNNKNYNKIILKFILGTGNEKIEKILEKSLLNQNNYLENRIKYKYCKNNDLDCEQTKELNNNENLAYIEGENDSFSFSSEMTVDIESPTLDVRNIKKFPYTAIGTLLVKFPISDKDYFYTCFLIDANIVVTLASNLIDKNKGGKAISIKTSFINKNVKWENIYIQNDLKEINLNDKEKDLRSNLAVILYHDNFCNEWIGVEAGKKEEFAGRDINAVVSLGIIKDSTNNKIEKD